MRIDLRRIRSNPIWWLDHQWNAQFHGRNAENASAFLQAVHAKLSELHLKSGVTFPRNPGVHPLIDFAGIQLGKRRPGSVGLMVKNDLGFVTELTARKSATWRVEKNLPFREEHAIDAVYQILKCCSVDDFVAPLQGFELCDSLGERAEGGSMDVSCLMAIIDEVNERKIPLLDCVCSVVQPGANATLEPVGGIAAKIKAFAREYDDGSLLVYHSGSASELQPFLKLFGAAWCVSSFQELANHLEQANLISELLSSHNLTLDSVEAIKKQVQFLERDESRIPEALELVSKSMKCIDDQTPLRIRLALVQAAGDLHRHAGSFSLAIENSEKYLGENTDGLGSYEDLLTRDYRLSAAYYDAHRFDDSKGLLTPWIEKVKSDPKIVSLESKPKLLNSQARILAVMGSSGWRELFEESIEIQSSLKSPDVARTRNYLIKCLLKASLLDDAEKEIEKSLNSDIDKTSSDHLEFFRADLARRRQQVWPKVYEEIQTASEHAKAFFYQAYARQPHQRDRSCRVLKVAAESLRSGLVGSSLNIRGFLASSCDLAAAVYEDDASAVREATNAIESFIGQPECTCLQNYYRQDLDSIKQEPSVGNLNKLFDRIPHF